MKYFMLDHYACLAYGGVCESSLPAILTARCIFAPRLRAMDTTTQRRQPRPHVRCSVGEQNHRFKLSRTLTTGRQSIEGLRVTDADDRHKVNRGAKSFAFALSLSPLHFRFRLLS